MSLEESKRFGELRAALHLPGEAKLLGAVEVLAQMSERELEAALPYTRSFLGGGDFTLWLMLAQDPLEPGPLLVEAERIGELSWLYRQLAGSERLAYANTPEGWAVFARELGAQLPEATREVACLMIEEALRWADRLEPAHIEIHLEYIKVVRVLLEYQRHKPARGDEFMTYSQRLYEHIAQFWDEDSSADQPGYLFWGFVLSGMDVILTNYPGSVQLLEQLSKELTMACFEVLAQTSQDLELCNQTLLDAQARMGKEPYDTLSMEITGLIISKLASQVLERQ